MGLDSVEHEYSSRHRSLTIRRRDVICGYLLSVSAAAPPKHSPSVFGILPTENELFTLFLLHYTTGPFENPTRRVLVASYVNAHLWVCITE